jgi:3-oxo-5alpha-steroid 4-dehydrogenase
MDFPEWWPSQIEAAVRAEDLGEGDWSDRADMVVVGYGGAGVCATLQGLEGGLSVIAIDRGRGGGATAINGGVFYAGGGTGTQIKAGVEDSVEAMFQYLKIEAGGIVSDGTLRRFCEGSATDHDWLEKYGVGFNPSLYAKKTSFPPTAYFLYHSDSSLAQTYADKIKPAARGHRVNMAAKGGEATGFGKAFYQPLKDSAAAAGAKVYSRTVVTALIKDAEDAVVGVKVRRIPDASPHHEAWRALQTKIIKMSSIPRTWPGASWFDAQVAKLTIKADALMAEHGEDLYLRATRGVVLSAGGHIFNRKMVRHFSPDYIKGLPLGTPADDGSGTALGMTVGAKTDGLERISAWRFINPPYSWARGPMINSSGQRFVDETLYGAAIGKAMCEGRDGKAWVILDQALIKAARAEASAKDVLDFQKWPALMSMMIGAKKASSLAGLAKKLGVPVQPMIDAIAQHDAAARGEVTDAFNKRGSDAAALGKGPYYAINVSIDAPLLPLSTLTLGGLVVDEVTGQVRDDNGQSIKGLYAAGRSAIGICSNIYVSGLSVADCVFSGRRAAKSLVSHGR